MGTFGAGSDMGYIDTQWQGLSSFEPKKDLDSQKEGHLIKGFFFNIDKEN